eukprot:SAG31_NODE_257_length_18942_cov_6.099135_2_plen_311_part_00
MACTDEIETIDECFPLAIRCGKHARAVRNVERRLTCCARSQRSNSVSVTFAIRFTPAELTKMSRPSEDAQFTVAFTAAWTDFSEETSHSTKMAGTQYWRLMVATTASPAMRSRSAAATAQPSAAKSRAVARPMPFAAPVMNAVFPCSRFLPSCSRLVAAAIATTDLSFGLLSRGIFLALAGRTTKGNEGRHDDLRTTASRPDCRWLLRTSVARPQHCTGLGCPGQRQSASAVAVAPARSAVAAGGGRSWRRQQFPPAPCGSNCVRRLLVRTRCLPCAPSRAATHVAMAHGCSTPWKFSVSSYGRRYVDLP